jgi:DNA-binding transcriptional regulator GbsR (MarR family)
MPDRNSDPEPAGSPSERIATAQERFIGLWGEMGSAWGIPRTMAEAHALLYIVGEPMNTDEVMDRLHVSRGNASMTLRTLVEWGLVARVHNRGDRKEYFRAEQDVWRLFATIVRQRKRREFDPLLAALEECRSLTASAAGSRRKIDRDASALDAHRRRLDRMLETLRTLDQLSERFIASGGPGMQLATKLLGRKKVS